MTPLSFANELLCDGAAGRYRRDISSFWTFGDDRVFGGYTAALTLAAAAREIDMPWLLSSHVMFVDATRVGPTEMHIETLRRGRSVAAVRAEMRQEGKPTLVAEAWFAAEAPSSTAQSCIPCTDRPVETYPTIEFRAAVLPFMAVLEEKAIDYPSSEAEFCSGPSVCDVWVRPGIDPGVSNLPLSQLFDVMVLDAHMLDPARRVRKSHRIVSASLDLGVVWYQRGRVSDWRRVRTESASAEGGFVATTGEIQGERGNVLARATQQGILFHPK